MEVVPVAFVFKQVDLCQKLFFLLFQLHDLFFQFAGVHRVGSDGLHALVHRLELSLQVFVDLHRFTHLFVNHEFVWDRERDEETRGVRFTLEVGQAG